MHVFSFCSCRYPYDRKAFSSMTEYVPIYGSEHVAKHVDIDPMGDGKIYCFFSSPACRGGLLFYYRLCSSAFAFETQIGPHRNEVHNSLYSI